MFGILCAASAVAAMCGLVRLVMTTITAGIQGRPAPVRALDRPARLITVKSEMLLVDDEYRRIVADYRGR